MNTKSKMLPWNVLLGISILSLVVMLGFHLLVPPPKFQMTGKAVADQENRLRKQVHAMYSDTLVAERFSADRLWTESADLVGPATLQASTAAANKLGIKLSAFRPQKPVSEGSLTRLPFLVSIEGSYPKIIDFVREMESSEHRVVVHVVQIASSDGSSSAVTALVGLWAFQKAPVTVKKGKSNV